MDLFESKWKSYLSEGENEYKKDAEEKAKKSSAKKPASSNAKKDFKPDNVDAAEEAMGFYNKLLSVDKDQDKVLKYINKITENPKDFEKYSMDDHLKAFEEFDATLEEALSKTQRSILIGMATLLLGGALSPIGDYFDDNPAEKPQIEMAQKGGGSSDDGNDPGDGGDKTQPDNVIDDDDIPSSIETYNITPDAIESEQSDMYKVVYDSDGNPYAQNIHDGAIEFQLTPNEAPINWNTVDFGDFEKLGYDDDLKYIQDAYGIEGYEDDGDEEYGSGIKKLYLTPEVFNSFDTGEFRLTYDGPVGGGIQFKVHSSDDNSKWVGEIIVKGGPEADIDFSRDNLDISDRLAKQLTDKYDNPAKPLNKTKKIKRNSSDSASSNSSSSNYDFDWSNSTYKDVWEKGKAVDVKEVPVPGYPGQGIAEYTIKYNGKTYKMFQDVARDGYKLYDSNGDVVGIAYDR